MALAGDLERAGYDPDSVETAAAVTPEKEDGEWTITRSHPDTAVEREAIDDDELQEIAEGSRRRVRCRARSAAQRRPSTRSCGGAGRNRPPGARPGPR